MHADPLSDMLQLVKPRAYGFRGLDAGGAWSLRLPAQAVLRCYAVQAGGCGLWLGDAAAPIALAAGDFLLVPHGEALVLGSARDAPAIDLDGFFAMAAGATATIQGGGGCRGLGGYFALSGPGVGPLLAALPRTVRLAAEPGGSGLFWLVERLMAELRAPRPGGRLIADHLAQSLLVEALRLHLPAAAAAGRGGWLAALADPPLARALGAIHAEPGRRWTVAALAAIAGLSRSAFAQRFARACGEAPIAYVARWRMLLAAERLAAGAPIARLARELGYGSESAFGVAFRRICGGSPGRLRRDGAAGG
ncbi:AraC family transcriptional regulator [Sphingomonas morindae]|uniref:AraC family transcriptional regulator n=1 Tax=Sphingomonas morindae TaxID=1541170 RepID=A0ABY4X3J3_9SPHN|nr:AraC family transcriptional regulator [Sphingomonas morindae]USI71454.1 AraC family transcriptional regulator [Sphingomonas morindae]